jgi:hypothetical protein
MIGLVTGYVVVLSVFLVIGHYARLGAMGPQVAVIFILPLDSVLGLTVPLDSSSTTTTTTTTTSVVWDPTALLRYPPVSLLIIICCLLGVFMILQMTGVIKYLSKKEWTLELPF